MKCGIVGLPNVGKSTLFNALTKAGIAAENYPFCTIEPNVGIVAVPDPRLDAVEKQISKHAKIAQTAGDKEAQRLVAALKKVQLVLDAGQPARTADLSKEERAIIRPLFLLTMKPTMYIANVAEHGSDSLL